MKTAYDYIRISDDDQSHFSIDGQKKMNLDFALRHDVKIVKTFVDEGYSAKDFNRPYWKELEKALSKNKSKIDYLIVWKYDRLIRNAAEGLTFIEKLEKKWNIVLLSVMENFGIDPSTPYFFKHRADLLVSAEFERRLISDRTKMGNWSAKDSGRYIGRASIGYNNARDNEGKPILVVNEEKKPVVENIFNDFLSDVPYPIIKQRVNERWGVNLKGHEAIKDIISNHTYAGLVKVPEYHGKKSYMKKGIHEAIIPEEIFWKAFYRLQDKTKSQGPKIVDANVPLRGWVICQGCGGYLTGGKSKGRSAYYNYYRCKKCVGENYNAENVHDEIIEILNNLSLKEKYIKGLIAEAEIQLHKEIEGKSQMLKKAKFEFEQIKNKLDSLEEKYISNKIAQDSYDKWFPVYSKELNTKGFEIADLEKDHSEELKQYKQMLPALTDMAVLYKIGEVDDKQAFLKGIFWGGFIKEKVGGRTKVLNPMFEPNIANISHLLRVENIGKPENFSGFPFSTPFQTKYERTP
jgi:site-specific DNA recombinase